MEISTSVVFLAFFARTKKDLGNSGSCWENQVELEYEE